MKTKNIIKGFSNPKLLAREINKTYFRLSAWLNYDNQSIVSRNWDTLIILDACRYDLFKNQTTLDGDLTKRNSHASTTVEFLQRNFSDVDLDEIVYTTANPQLAQHGSRFNIKFHDVINVWKSEGWDSNYGTVLPETMTDAGLKSHLDYPNKRHVVHYIQPHYPFLTESSYDKGQLNAEEISENFWKKILLGRINISPESIWDDYQTTLDKTLPYVKKLVEEIDGKKVVTSDHGNAIGERSFPISIREWGHPSNNYITPLIEVPWLEIANGNRRDIRRGEGKEVETVDAKEKLRDLGYM